MSPRFIGVRWWLGAAFAVVAAVSTAIVVSQFSTRSENAFRGRAEVLASGNALVAARQVEAAERHGTLAKSLRSIARRQNLDLFVYSRSGKRIAAAPARGKLASAPGEQQKALADALADEQLVTSTPSGRIVVVGVPLRAGPAAALVAFSSRPDVAAAIGIVSDQALRAGVIAGLIGVIVGLLLAQLIALRLRRLSAAAEALASGDFETPLRYRFRDEFGALAQSFDRMRRQLRRSFRRIEVERDRLRLLLERLHEGVITVDQDLAVHFSNSEARRLLGALDEGDPLPEPWRGFSLREFAEQLFQQDASPSQVHVSPDSEHAYGLVGIPAQPDGEWALIVLDDLTEEQRRELAEREFVSNAAHELRTPLTTIIGAVEVLQAGAKDDPEERDRFLAHIEREAARLARLARALLTLARAHAGQERPRVEPVQLRPLLREVADGLRPRDGVVVEVDCAAGLTALANRDLVEQALRNLGENAAKHTARGRVTLRAAGAGDTVTIGVEDTGPGMSPETQRHVFDRFYRGGMNRDPEGFGLGLAIVRQAVRSLGGRIELDSSPERGTSVRIVLERARVREEATVA